MCARMQAPQTAGRDGWAGSPSWPVVIYCLRRRRLILAGCGRGQHVEQRAESQNRNGWRGKSSPDAMVVVNASGSHIKLAAVATLVTPSSHRTFGAHGSTLPRSERKLLCYNSFTPLADEN